MIAKRLPAARPGKGRALMYVNGTGPALPTSEAVARSVGGVPTWHKGAMSKRFDGKDETPSTTAAPKPVMPPVSSDASHHDSLNLGIPLQITVASNVTKEDEAAAMAAMFQAQSQNWEETKERMSQSVSPLRGFHFLYSSILSNEHCPSFLPYSRVFQCSGGSSQPSGSRFRCARWKATHANQRQTITA